MLVDMDHLTPHNAASQPACVTFHKCRKSRTPLDSMKVSFQTLTAAQRLERSYRHTRFLLAQEAAVKVCPCPTQLTLQHSCWFANVSNQKSLAHPYRRAFSVARSILSAISLLLVVTTPGSKRCEVPLKAPEEEEIYEATAGVAVAIEISADAAAPAVLSERFHIKRRTKKMALKDFEKRWFCFPSRLTVARFSPN